MLPTTCDSVEAIDRVIDRIGQLHASPTVAQKLLQLTRDPEFSISEVADCLEHDPALAARILRVVNSSRYGLSRKVSSIRHAAAYLGQRSLRMFAITFALVETLTSKSPVSTGYWPRAITTASAVSLLCEHRAPKCRDDAYTSGLLADVGILVLAQLEAPRYEPLFATHEHGPELLDAEQEAFQFTHPLLGARLLQMWEVPDPVVNAVALHHGAASTGDILERVVQAGDLLASAVVDPEPEKIHRAALRFFDEFDIEGESFLSFAEMLEERVIKGEDLADCGTRLARRFQEFLQILRTEPEQTETVAM